MRGRWRVGLAVALAMVGGCGRGEDGAEADGEGLEPRIVTEGPVDSPGRPEGRGEAAASVVLDDGGRWVPHLTVGDLEASVEFYRGLGFAAEAAGGDEAERRELERDGVRLVLVAAEPAAAPAGEEGSVEEESAGEAARRAPPVLHLVDEAGGAPREVRDPDGHLLVISGG